MAKRIVDVGSPAYMAQYAALMIILLAFFILLNALAQVKEGGFKSGIGDVKNAFGLAGGLGLFNYAFAGKGGGNEPNPNASDEGERGIDKSLMLGDGGIGDTDLETQKADRPRFLRIKLKVDFDRFSYKIKEPMAEELKKIGIGFALFDYKVQIRNYSMDFSSEERNKSLAINRSARIMRFLNASAAVPYSKMECVGYSDERYFMAENETKTTSPGEKPEQGTYFYVLIRGGSTAPEKNTK